ncbi:hypothetical protein FRB95_014523 [Tulasnella sp. JGI-2019a]|nr:hypothetical protein FRB95_014523 [Tulasnella sp. JGI-2019a]
MFKFVFVLLLTGVTSKCDGSVDTDRNSVPELASNNSFIDTCISTKDQHLTGIPSCDTPYAYGAAAPTFTCRAVVMIPTNPLEGGLASHHLRIRLKSVCYEWCRSWSAPTPIPVLAPISLDWDHTGTDTRWSLDLSLVDVALNAPAIDIALKELPADQSSAPAMVDVASYASTIDIRTDANINIALDGLLANRPSAMVFVSVALTAPITDKDCENDVTSQGPVVGLPSGLKHASSLIHNNRNTNSSTFLLLVVAVVLSALLAIASCITLTLVILPRNKRHYKITAGLRTTINSLESELRQRVSAEENV